VEPAPDERGLLAPWKLSVCLCFAAARMIKPSKMPTAALTASHSARRPAIRPTITPAEQHNQNGTATFSTIIVWMPEAANRQQN
jgi:hypothetical protein